MAISRRSLLGAGLGSFLVGPLSAFGGAGSYRFACGTDRAEQHWFVAIESSGEPGIIIALPARGHGFGVRPGGDEVVVFSRRPGTFMSVVDLRTRAVVRTIESPPGRHFYGHGVFDPPGRHLFASENAYETGDGVIGIYDATDDFRRLGEFPSHGIGPHEVALLADGRTLVVANGGIRTHPETGRTKLNLDSMDPSLTYLAVDDGSLLGAWRPPSPWHQLSLRHLAVTPGDRVTVVAKYEGPANRHPPLVAFHAGEEALDLRPIPPGMSQSLRNYCGGVCADRSGRWLAVSAPRGNRVLFWSAAQRECLDAIEATDACGLCAGDSDGEFIVSAGTGTLVEANIAVGGATSSELRKPVGLRWDNHMA